MHCWSGVMVDRGTVPFNTGEGDRVHRMLSAMVGAGLKGGYLVNPMLAEVHWQAGDRPLPAPKVTVAGESELLVDPSEIPSSGDVGGLGRAMAARSHGERDELMVSLAAYSGSRWGELAALTIPQADEAGRVITVDRKVVEISGQLYVEAPKNRKFRRTIYPRLTPGGYPLAGRLAARIEEVRAEQEAGTNPLGLSFPASAGKYSRSSNFNRRILQPAYQKAGWRDISGEGQWTWHSLRHAFCTTALFTWKLDGTDVPRGWPGMPTTGSRWTCTSAPPPACSTAPAPPPNSPRLAGWGPDEAGRHARILGYVLMDYVGEYAVTGVALFSARYGYLAQWTLARFCRRWREGQ
jgi:hypothetical protein